MSNFYKTTANPNASEGEYNSMTYIMSQLINRIHTLVLVQVVSVTNSGTDIAVGFVDVQPIVNLIDASGASHQHSTIHNVPYFRIQGGANAVILDPQKGDIGLALFAEKDMSNAVANKAQASAATAGTSTNPLLSLPGSYRKFSFSDAFYLGGFLNGVPTQYVQFNTTGISIVSPNLILLQANDIQLTAPTIEMNASSSITATTPTFTVNGALTTTGQIKGGSVITNAGHNLDTHVHSGVSIGGSNTGAPV